jgi:hypothetical protein
MEFQFLTAYPKFIVYGRNLIIIDLSRVNFVRGYFR